MRAEADAPIAADDEFLDQVLERAVASFQAGAEPQVAALLAGREHLRAAVEALLETARFATAARAPAALPTVRGYRMLGEIGRGGMGAVYLARQELLGDRPVALKVLPGAALLSPRSRERFLSEARALANLRHPHVVTVHEVVAESGVHAYAMEWIDGASLGQLIASQRRALGADPTGRGEPAMTVVRELLPEPGPAAEPSYAVFVARIGIAIARALGALHRAGLVHRDVKPANILLRKDGTALLSDFGLVHAADVSLTQSGSFAGTIAYASPEQLEGASESLDARSDVYALGVTLYHALALHLPFDAPRGRATRPTSPTGMLRLIERGRAAPLRAWNRGLPRDLETIVAKAIEAEPARRYASADELADDLERLLALRPIRARRTGWLARAAKLARRNRATAFGFGIGSALSLALAAALVVYVFLAPRWLEEHVRRARLALLDPAQANLVFVAHSFRGPSDPGDGSAAVRGEALDAALEHLDAALLWRPFDAEVRAERDAVASVREAPARGGTGRSPVAADRRSAGLIAYLRGDAEAALELWLQCERERDARAPPDPLLEAALGILHLVREEPALAYPRLRQACRSFPDVGFLATYLADAAVGCGDVESAERWLAAAGRMPLLDDNNAIERVRADLCAARGRDAEAEALYRRASFGPLARVHYARFLASRGRREEALEQLTAGMANVRYERLQEEYAALLGAWWRELSGTERLRRIRSALDLGHDAPGSLVARLRALAPARSSLDGARPPEETVSSTIAAKTASPTLQNRSLVDLARTLEVHDMARWNSIRTYSPLFKKLQVEAWASPLPIRASRALALVAEWLRPRAPRLAFCAVVVGFAGAGASAQNCPGAPCFQGLGDLPGGATWSHASCLSSDGTTVGGSSSTALSAGEPRDEEGFVWRHATGMVYVGDLPGNGECGAVYGLSGDGSIAVGYSSSAGFDNSGWEPFPEAFRWTQAGGIVGLGELPTGARTSVASAISDDGSIIFGWSHAASGSYSSVRRAATWTSAGGWVDRGTTGMFDSFFGRCSRDGQWGCGREVVQNTPGQSRTFRWSDFLGIENLAQADSAGGWAVSDTGTVVGNFGNSVYEAAVWQNGGATQSLGDLAGGGFSSSALGILRDGTLIVGYGTSGGGQEAVLWDEARSIHRVVDVLIGAGVAIPAGWTLTVASDIVRNGNVITICGTGTNPSGNTEAWIARFDGYPTELFCFGDGTGTACPCANHSNVGDDDGCLNSLGTGGRLRTSGTADLGADTLTLLGSQMPNSFALYFQGSTLVAGGNGSLFGDGLRCAGSIIRLGTKQNAGGASQYPEPGDPSVSVRGLVVAPGGWRFYQAWYRNAAAYCTASTFNLSNAARVFWVN